MRTLLPASVFLRFKQLLLALIVIGALYIFCSGDASPNQIHPTPASVQLFGTNEKKALVASPVGINGQLKVCGNSLCNQYGKAIQLRGMSTHGLQWHGWNKCITEGSLDALAKDWGADVMRVSMYVQEDGYEKDPAGFTIQADRIIDELIKRGLYVVIDWHILDPGDPIYNQGRAKIYFDHMSKKYGNTPNVLYEIANEPRAVFKST